MDTYQAQRRGGKGRSATSVKDEDFVEHMLVVNSHDTVLCFTDMGKVYWLTVYDIPQASRNAKGRPIVNVLNLDEGERITTRSEEHTSELQSRPHLVCRLLLQKKKSGPARGLRSRPGPSSRSVRGPRSAGRWRPAPRRPWPPPRRREPRAAPARPARPPARGCRG